MSSLSFFFFYHLCCHFRCSLFAVCISVKSQLHFRGPFRCPKMSPRKCLPENVSPRMSLQKCLPTDMFAVMFAVRCLLFAVCCSLSNFQLKVSFIFAVLFAVRKCHSENVTPKMSPQKCLAAMFAVMFAGTFA